MKIPRSDIASVVELTLGMGYRRATKYLSDRFVVRAARRFKQHKRQTRQEIVLTFGAPNYAEREFIKSCVKAGEKFPIRKVQLKSFK